QQPIQLLAVVHGRIGHRIMPDQLVLGVRVHMVLVAEEAAAMLLDPARVAVLLPQLGGLLLPSCRCAPSLQLGVLITTVPLRRHRHDTGVDDLPATRHVALGRKMLVKAVEQLLDQPSTLPRLSPGLFLPYRVLPRTDRLRCQSSFPPAGGPQALQGREFVTPGVTPKQESPTRRRGAPRWSRRFPEYSRSS